MHYFAANYVDPADRAYNRNNPVALWQNLTTVSGLSSTSAAAGFPVTNLANPSTAEFWKGNVLAQEDVTVSFPSQSVDCIAIQGHNAFSAGCAISFYYTPPAGSLTLIQTIGIPTDDSVIMFRFAAKIAESITVRFAAGSIKPQASVIAVGTAMMFPHRLYVGHTPLQMGRQIKVATGRSGGGAFLGRIILGEATSNTVELKHIDPSWYRTNMVPFLREAEESPFFFAWRPERYPGEVDYVWITNEPRPTNQLANGMMQVDLELSGVSL